MPIFSHYTQNQLKKILPLYTEKTLGRNEILFHQGNKPDFVYIVITGEIELYRCNKPKRVMIDPKKDRIKQALNFNA